MGEQFDHTKNIFGTFIKLHLLKSGELPETERWKKKTRLRVHPNADPSQRLTMWPRWFRESDVFQNTGRRSRCFYGGFFFPSLKLRYPLKMDGWNTRQFPFGSFFHYTYKCFKKGPLKHAYIMFLPFLLKVWCQIKKDMFAYNFLSQDSIVSWTSKIDVFNPLNSLHIMPQHRQQDPIPIESP